MGLVWGLALAFVVLLAARAFVGDVYRVRSGSMRPALWSDEEGSDWALVSFGGRRELKRFDLVVVRREGEPEPFVKRVVGLGGERVRIVGGDLWVDGALLPPDAWRPPLVPLWRPGAGPLAEFWAVPQSGWDVEGDELVLRSPEPDTPAAPLRERPILTDGWIAPDGTRQAGTVEVNDVELSVELAVSAPRPGASGPCGTVVLSVSEAADTFDCTVRWAPGAADLELWRRDLAGGRVRLGGARVDIERDGWARVAVANIDDCVRASWAGRVVIEAPYAANRVLVPRPGSNQHNVKPRVSITGWGKDPIHLRAPRVARDLYWTGRGRWGVREPLDLAPDELFLLGDASSQSTDGRFWGPLRRSDVIGRVRAVVWPPDRIRRTR